MIIVEPPETPPALIEQIEESLVACGLDAERIRLVFSEERQRIEIYVPAPSGANNETVSCLVNSGRPGRVIFEEEQLRVIYSEMLDQRHNRIRTAARAYLENEGKLANLPQKANFSTESDFAHALEKFCGFAPESVLQVGGGSTIFYPPDQSESLSDSERKAYTCMAATFSIVSMEKEEETWEGFDIQSAFPKNEGKDSAQTH